MPNPRQARRIVRDRQPDRPGRMWFKPYYGIEAERVGRDRGLCASAILSPEVCYLREAIGDFARWSSRFVAGLPRSSFCANHHVPPMASTPACKFGGVVLTCACAQAPVRAATHAEQN